MGPTWVLSAPDGPMSTPWTLLSGIYFPCSLSACNRRYLTWASRHYQVIASSCTVYPKKYAHGFCFAVLCCGYTLTDFPISIRLTSLALWQSNDCPSASKALHNHNKAKHNETVCIFLGIYCTYGTLLNGINFSLAAVTIGITFTSFN